MAKKLQVFISSTYIDMKEERQAAVEAVLTAGHIPAGMELFSAGSESQLKVIRQWIDDSDVFMLILGGRYGSIEPKSGKSYIELEYDYAVEQDKPFFAVVMSDSRLDHKVKSNGKAVIETDNGHLFKAFREKVTSKMCRFFGDINELKLNSLHALSSMARIETMAGWVRGSEVVDARATLEEISRLQSENAQLRHELEAQEKLTKSSKSGLAESLSLDQRAILIHLLNGAYVTVQRRRSISFSNDLVIYFVDCERAYLRWEFATRRLFEMGYLERNEIYNRVAFDFVSNTILSNVEPEDYACSLSWLGYEAAEEIQKKKLESSALPSPGSASLKSVSEGG